MAKKKKSSKHKEKEGFNYSVELTGLLLIVIGIIGFGFGPVGKMIKQFAMFLVGEWWTLILLLILFMGLFMLIKRKLPNFFTAKLLGVYLIILVALTASHIGYINKVESKEFEATQLVNETLNNYKLRIIYSMADFEVLKQCLIDNEIELPVDTVFLNLKNYQIV